MKAITVRYRGPGNVRGSRFIVTDGDSRKVYHTDHRLTHDAGAAQAAIRFAQWRGWQGVLLEGSTREGWVFVFDGSTRHVIPNEPIDDMPDDARSEARS